MMWFFNLFLDSPGVKEVPDLHPQHLNSLEPGYLIVMERETDCVDDCWAHGITEHYFNW